jgi:hypothetical protein
VPRRRRKAEPAVENRCRYCWKPIPLYPADSKPLIRRRRREARDKTLGMWEYETYDARKQLEFCCDEHKRAFGRQPTTRRPDELTMDAIAKGVTSMSVDAGPDVEQPSLL